MLYSDIQSQKGVYNQFSSIIVKIK